MADLTQIMEVIPLLLLLAISAHSVSTEVSSSAFEPKVFELVHNTTFKPFINENSLVAVEFYTTWCSQSEEFAAAWKEATSILENGQVPIRMARMDVTNATNITDTLGVYAFPVAFIFRDAIAFSYQGGATKEEIVQYLANEANPLWTRFPSATALSEELLLDTDVRAVGLFSSSNSPLHTSFLHAANRLHAYLNFSYVEAPDAVSFFASKLEAAPSGQHDPSSLHIPHGTEDVVLLFTDPRFAYGPEPPHHVYNEAPESETTLIKWLLDASVPIVGEASSKTVLRYMEKGKAILKVYTELDWRTAKAKKKTRAKIDTLRAIAATRDIGQNISLTLAQHDNFAMEMRRLGLTYDGSAVAALSDTEDNKFPAQGVPFYTDDMVEWIQEYRAGEFKPFVRTTAVPIDNENKPIKEVVGSTFNTMVNGNKKHVFLYMYTASCHHCQELEPQLKEVSQWLLTNMSAKAHTEMLQIDAGTNDVGVQFALPSVPLLYWVDANQKNDPMPFTGYQVKPNAEHMIQFLKQHSHGSLAVPQEGKAAKSKVGHSEL